MPILPPKQKPASFRHALYGITLPATVLRALQKRGIYCMPGISVEHQRLARRHVLRGVESGGAVADMGRACAYLTSTGRALSRGYSRLIPLQSMDVTPFSLRRVW